MTDLADDAPELVRYHEREIYAYGGYIRCQILNWQEGPPPTYIVCHPLHETYHETFIAKKGMGTWMRVDYPELTALLDRLETAERDRDMWKGRAEIAVDIARSLQGKEPKFGKLT